MLKMIVTVGKRNVEEVVDIIYLNCGVFGLAKHDIISTPPYQLHALLSSSNTNSLVTVIYQFREYCCKSDSSSFPLRNVSCILALFKANP